MATRAEILAAVNYLAVAFPNWAPTPETVDAYVTDLSDIPGNAVFDAARSLRRSEEFMPTIAKWRTAAIEAWREIHRRQERPMLTAPLERPTPSPEQVTQVRAMVAGLLRSMRIREAGDAPRES